MLAVVWSPACAACDVPLAKPTRGIVCETCWRAVGRFGEPPGRREQGATERRITLLTRPTSAAPPTVVRAAGPYDGRLRAIIHAFKYGGHRSLARPLATLLRRTGGDLLERADLVVPVPLHWWRRRRRGFNQAAELAAHLGLPVVEALRRTRATPSQVGLSRSERRRSVVGAIVLSGAGGRAADRFARPGRPWAPRRAGGGRRSAGAR